MIGVSLALPLLCGRPESQAQANLMEVFSTPQALLAWLKDMGVESIELRSVNHDTLKEDAQAAAGAVGQAGLCMSIHAELTQDPAQTFFEKICPLLPEKTKTSTCLTVHSLWGLGRQNSPGSAQALGGWARYALERDIPVIFALENKRLGKEAFEVASCEAVMEVVDAIGLSSVGTCFDFGHLYSNYITHPARSPKILPPKAFVSQTRHTHIHAVEGTPHFPLMGEAQLPLWDYVGLLKETGYTGVYNLELEPERFYIRYNVKEAFKQSVGRLSEAISHAKRMFSEI